MHRKPLPKPPKDNQQIKEYTNAVRRGQKGYYVAPAKEGWSVRKASATRATDTFSTKAAAINYAKKAAPPQADIVIYSKNGQVTVLAVKARK